jgi:ribonuclease HII
LGPDLSLERAFGGSHGRVCGVDEAGRGPLAGPVAVAAVILDPDRPIVGLNDSKQLTPLRREQLFAEICEKAHVALIFATVARIDALNIRGATLWAMRAAIMALPIVPEAALIDGRDVPAGLPCRAEAIVAGDSRSQSIAAASIIAKVARDRLMRQIAGACPGYGFERHMGYGVPEHLDAIARLGPTPWHRRSFRPIAAALAERPA